MYIEGSDVGYSHQGTAFLSALGCTFISNDTQNVGTMTGQPGTITEGFVFPFNSGNDPNYSVDEIGGIFRNVIFKSTYNYSRTVAFGTSHYRTITSSPILGGFIDEGDNTKAALMGTYLGYLLKIDGRVRGVVLDADTQEPIVGANVTVGSASDITNDYGMYTVKLQPGSYSLTCTNTGYFNYNHPDIIEVDYNETTWINFDLTPLVAIDDDIQMLKNEITSVHPNPMMNNVQIHFTLAKSEEVEITLYNIKGQKVTTLLSEYKQAGVHTIEWKQDSQILAAGVYFLRMNVDEQNMVKKVLILE